MVDFFCGRRSIDVGAAKVELLGAVDRVTGAATLVRTAGGTLLLDAGVNQDRRGDPVRLEQAAEADALILTHGHLDHIGGIPRLLELGFRGRIHATPATLEIAMLSLQDALSFERIDEGRRRATLKTLRARFTPLPYDTPQRFGDTMVTLHEAGHILGSASVELVSPAARVIVSGDLGRPDSPILRDPNTEWDAERPVDLALVETTYGNRDHDSDSAAILETLERVVKRAERERGKVLVPAFAIGRTQLLIYYLDRLVETGRIADVPVAIDTPMGLSITETYQRHRKLYDREALELLARGDDPLDFDDLFAVRAGRDSRRLEDLEGPMVIVAGSGMCTGGRIVRHLANGLGDPRNTVLFVGYQGHGTPGRAILDAAERGLARVRFDGGEASLRAKVETLRGMSAHADRGELTRWLGALPQLRAVATHHGDAKAQESFVQYARSRLSG